MWDGRRVGVKVGRISSERASRTAVGLCMFCTCLDRSRHGGCCICVSRKPAFLKAMFSESVLAAFVVQLPTVVCSVVLDVGAACCKGVIVMCDLKGSARTLHGVFESIILVQAWILL